MPRNVRNFWIDATIDGRSSTLSGGPQSKTGGFSLVIKQRDKGGIVNTLHVSGYANEDGSLTLSVEGPDESKYPTVKDGSGHSHFRVKTVR